MKIIVFDTETIGKYTQELLNVGYQIVDVNPATAEAKVLIKRDYLTEIIGNEIFCINDDLVGEVKYNHYRLMLEQKKIIKHSLKKIFDIMANDLAKYQPLFGYAYNCNFDTDKFAKSAERYGLVNPLENLPIHDIWGYSCEFICQTKEYREWSEENENYTDSQQYFRTSVEGVCRYLYRDTEFIEEHTALSDTNHELFILLECIRRGCDITKPMARTVLKSGKVLTKIFQLPDGEELVVNYRSTYTRNGVQRFQM